MSVGDRFQEMLEHCRQINPSSMTSSDDGKIYSATIEGIDLVPDNLIGKDVLIVGCGDGYEVEYACAKGWKAVGLTFNAEEAEARPLTVRCGDMHDLPFAKNSFDFIYSKETLEHTPCPMLALFEMNRVLKPGGRFFHLIADGWQKQRDPYHYSCFPDWLWCDLFHKAMLKVEKVIGFPDAERCLFQNKAYSGIKYAEFRFGGSIETYRETIGFSPSWGAGPG